MKAPRALAAGIVMAVELMACTVGVPASPAPTPTQIPAPTQIPKPTASPSQTPGPTVPPLTLPTPNNTAATPCPTNSAGDAAVPPDAQVTGGDGSSVTGKVGSYTFCGTSADALPPKAANVAAVALGTSATVALKMLGGWGITGYRAGYWSAAEWQGDEIALGSDMFTEPAIATSFSGPPAGDWMLTVHVTFPASGNATYYWHVTVP